MRRLLVGAAFFLLAACGEDEKPAPPAREIGPLPAGLSAAAQEKAVAALNRGVALMDRYEPKDAVPHFEEALKHAPGWAAARFDLGLALLNAELETLYPRAEQELSKVAKEVPADPRGHYAWAMLLQHLGRYPEAVRELKKVLEIDPDDPDTHLRLGMILKDDDPKAARTHLEKTLERTPHHEAATYHLYTLLRDAGEDEKAKALLERFQSLKATGAGKPSGMKFGEMGRYADLVRWFERAPASAAAVASFDWTDIAERLGLMKTPAEPGGKVPKVAVSDVDGDGDLDLYLVRETQGGLFLAEGPKYVRSEPSGIDGKDATGAWFGDYDGDGDPDLFLSALPNRLYRNDGGKFADVSAEAGIERDAVVTNCAWADFDHDGDLDLFACGDPDALWQNDGNGKFADTAAAAGIKTSSWRVLVFDADGDMDLDLLLLRSVSVRSSLFLNDRVGRWRDASALYPDLVRPATAAALGDVDGDGREDVLLAGESRVLVLQREWGRFSEDLNSKGVLAGVSRGVPALADVDADGDLDVLFLRGHGGDVLQNLGAALLSDPKSIETAPKGGVAGQIVTDIDGDGSIDVVTVVHDGGIHVWTAPVAKGRHWLEVVPDVRRPLETGKRATEAVGLFVEAKTGRRLFTGRILESPLVVRLGLGPFEKVDYVRLFWPDGVIQSEMEVAADQRWKVAKVERKPSSCPILFCWDGTQFAYVTDFLGVGGVGFFQKPGEYAPADPTEDVRIPPEQVAPKDGKYLLRVAEPLEEVTWLDETHLVVHDHPASWEVYPDERFTGSEPWPTAKPIAVETKLFPKAARDEQGRDVLDRVLAVDRKYVDVPLEPRFVGYAKDHWLELDFGEQVRALPKDAKVVLFLHGWVEYTYSHVNYAAFQAGLALKSPFLEVPAGNGAWKTAMAEAGFPAGLPRMITVDVTALPLRADGRLRIRSNMQVYWDQVFLGEDVAARGIETRTLAPTAASLRFLGYPREYSPDGQDPTLFDYRRIDPAAPFKAMAGDFTRFGDVRELLLAVDEKNVVMGRGEEVALEFDAASLPPVGQGRARTLFLHADGWCKDMDLYTAFPDTVEPTPYHGAVNYPPEKPLPNSAALQDYRRTWNTRRVAR